MYQPWLVSHLNGRSDKGSLSGGPGEMLSRSHALTPRDVYRDVIIEPKYFVNALPTRPNDTSRLTRDVPSTAEIDSSRCFVHFGSPNDFFGRDDRSGRVVQRRFIHLREMHAYYDVFYDE